MYKCAIVCILFFTLTFVQSIPCHSHDQCGSGECCYKAVDNPIMSRRAVDLPLPGIGLSQNRTGVCERFTPANAHCDAFGVMNGHCGCVHGYSCKVVKDTSRQKRGALMPGLTTRCMPSAASTVG
ncbi:hypothetical protein ScPMuIL_004511 [Solemya velum]